MYELISRINLGFFFSFQGEINTFPLLNQQRSVVCPVCLFDFRIFGVEGEAGVDWLNEQTDQVLLLESSN